MKKIIFTIFLLLAVAGCTQETTTQDQISFTAQIYDTENTLVLEKEITTTAGENAFDALQENDFPFEYEESTYGIFVTRVSGITPEEGTYVAIYVDDEYASVGLSDLELYNEMDLKFKIEEFPEFE